MTANAPLVIFSDLDGTLLDHNTYSFEAARPALERTQRYAIPVVLATSKTANEVVPLQTAMSLQRWPAIVENGTGVIGMEAKPPDYARLRDALDQMPEHLRACFRGFGDMDVEEIAKLTGLSASDVENARSRAYSEPGLWRGCVDEKSAFLAALKEAGIHATEGGRFLTLSFGGTKKDGMRQIISRLLPEITVALGDAPNDIDMLEHADFGIVVANPHRPPLPFLRGEAAGRITRTKLAGPAGWNAAVHELLDSRDLE